jgi:3-deoxy-D-manno-octulosonic-acid transferase
VPPYSNRALLNRFAWLLYGALVEAAVWLLLVPWNSVQRARGRVTNGDVREWLGAASIAPRRTARRIVVHAVSAGEMAAAGAFVAAIGRTRPDWSVVLTCGNHAGRAMAAHLEQQFASVEQVLFLPWDRRAAVDRFVRRAEADAFVIVEPEIWPNLYRACERAGVPMFLVNARIYPRDVERYRLVRWFLADVLRLPAWIAAQSERDSAALVSIGAPAARVRVEGSFKFDVAATGGDLAGHR